MEAKGFSIGEAIKLGWKAFKEHIGFFIAVLIIAFIIQLIPNLFASYFRIENDELHRVSFMIYSSLFSIINYVLSLVIAMGLIQISLSILDRNEAKYSDLFKPFSKVFNYFVAQIVYTLILAVGMILLVFPMIIWAVRYGLFPFFIVDKNAGPFEALELSSKTTNGAKWDLLGLAIVSGLINLIGILCIFIGLFATIPLTLVAHTFVYRKLVAQSANKHLEVQP